MGFLLLGRDIETAFDVAERLDRNAYITLQARNLLPPNVDPGAVMSKACGDTVAQFKASHSA